MHFLKLIINKTIKLFKFYWAMNSRVLITVILSTLCLIAQNKFFTQRKVWAFWSGNFSEASDFYKLCEYKIRSLCEKQGWEYTFLTNDNLHLYLNNYSAFQQVVSNRKLMYPQNLGDYIKLLIIHDQGGVFFDITSILFQGLNWLLELQNNPKLITNYKVGVEPEVILFYSSMQQSSTQYYQDQILKNLLPGYQISFIAGKKNSSTLQLIIKQFQQMYTKSFEQNIKLIYGNNIFYRNLDYSYYLTTQKSISFAVQKFQQQLDNNLSLFGKRKNANEELKIWAIHCQDTSMMPIYYFTHLRDAYRYTIQQLGEKHHKIPKFYVKYSQGGQMFHKFMDSLKQFFSKYQSFDKFYESKPTKYDCQSKQFIVKGSILGLLLSQNKIAQQLGLSLISVEQRTKWENYCQRFIFKSETHTLYSLIRSLIMLPFFSLCDQNLFQRLKIDKQFSLIQSFKIIIYQNRFFFEFCVAVYIIFLTVISGIALIKNLALNKLESYFRKKRVDKTELSIWNKILILVYLPTAPLLYFHVTHLGRYHRQQQILFTYTAFVLVKKFIFEKKPQERIFGITVQQVGNILKSVVYFFITKSLLYSVESRDENVIPYAFLIGLVSPQIVKSAQSIIKSKGEQSNLLLRKLVQHSQVMVSMFVFNIICLFIFLPNVKFVRANNRYVIRYLMYPVLGYIGVLFALVCFEVVKSISSPLKLTITKGIMGFKAKQIVNLMQVLLISSLIYRVYQFHQNFISWVGIEEKVFVQVFLIFTFISVNLGHSEIFADDSLTKLPQQNENVSDDSIQPLVMKSNYGLQEHNLATYACTQQPKNLFQIVNKQICTFLLCNLVPFVMVVLGWIYKQNEYKEIKHFPIEFLATIVNSAAVLVWKQILIKNSSSNLLKGKEKIIYDL